MVGVGLKIGFFLNTEGNLKMQTPELCRSYKVVFNLKSFPYNNEITQI